MPGKSKFILEKLYSLHRFGIKPGLERTLALAEYAGNPHSKYPSVHIAGTNGKGSVSSFISSVLTEAGYKTGLYTSPHLVRFNERIRINGLEIDDGELIKLAEYLMPESDTLQCTFFEITTVMAFRYFALNNVDIAVIETGMGGRYDSTNIILPDVSVITSIGLEHREYLGNSLQEIAFEKSGIIKPGIPVIISPNEPEALVVFANTAIEKNSPAIYSNMAKYCNYKIDGSLGMTLDIYAANDDYKGLVSPVAGIHQANNLKSAILALECLSEKFTITKQNIYDGIRNVAKNTGLNSRTKLVQKKPPVIADVSHNESSVKALVRLLSESCYTDTKWHILLALMDDKDAQAILKLLEPLCRTLTITKPATDRAFAPEKLGNTANNCGIWNINIISNPAEALTMLYKTGEPVLICGSFYLIGELMEYGLLNDARYSE